jgi:hypothetical protein
MALEKLLAMSAPCGLVVGAAPAEGVTPSLVESI